jgi:hypothetical protein
MRAQDFGKNLRHQIFLNKVKRTPLVSVKSRNPARRMSNIQYQISNVKLEYLLFIFLLDIGTYWTLVII